MKFMHIGDLHLGKKLNGQNLCLDQKDALNQLIEIAENEKLDAVVIAGDVYDKNVPPNEAYDLFNDFLTELVKLKIKVFCISGNHDAEEKISYFSYMLKNNDIYMSTEFTGTTQVYDINDEYGVIHIHLLPFIKPSNVAKFYPDIDIDSYDTAFKTVIEHSNINKEERNIIVTHQYFNNASTSGSEEMIIGGLDNIDASCLFDFDYAACGHIHKYQKVIKDYIMYCGSLLKYSIDEASYKKGPLIVELKEKNDLTINQVPIKLLHDVRVVEGLYDDLMNEQFSDDYVKIIIHDEFVDADAKTNLLQIFPNIMSFVIENSKTNVEFNFEENDHIEEKSIDELFVDFYRSQNNNQSPTDEQMKYIINVIKKMEENNNNETD